ncbi:hypothetical protein ILUMI_07048 [Ignelater luminosus]|uniref:Xaa-Pro dipeptidase n=1 Tax=Ignelater luminosus TaxID=2038154 RepID=A0A8K0GES1_IGNLU|nr:hypothetical protein ILUMI_07048 [Ignelater luminosus]
MPFVNKKIWLGQGTYEIPAELFSLNRKRLVDRLKPLIPHGKAIVVLQGGKELPIYDSDMAYIFRQESYFRWAFGVSEAGCYGAIDIDTEKSHLFIPHYPESYAVWMGPLHVPQDFKEKYVIDYVHYADEISKVLKSLTPSVLLTLKGINTDSDLPHEITRFEGIEQFNVDDKILFPEIADLRVIKTHYEIDVMRYVAEVSSAGHRKIMKMVKPGTYEYFYESEYLNHIYGTGGCRHTPYTCICCSGPNCAILHYGHAGAPNDRLIRDGDVCLFDMGGIYFGYGTDITCSFPANGKFTSDQKMIYEAVLKANLAVANEAKPGVTWPCMHLLACRVLLSALKDGGLLRGDVSEMVTAGVGGVFQPHGLGHLIGLECHDVGGYLPGNPVRLTEPKGLEKLRTARTLQKGMVVTIEPGCYFVDVVLDKALRDDVLSKFLIPEAIERFRGFGGVRIEDVVVITDTGIKNLTVVPRTVEEIENWMAKETEANSEFL